MNANQARLIAHSNSESWRKEIMKKVFSCIKNAAQNGEFETTFDAATNEEMLVISDELINLGYNVRQNITTTKPIGVNQLTSINISWQ